MCLYDAIVLLYALNTEKFHYNENILPRISRVSLFQYKNSLNLAYLVTSALALPET